MPGRASLMGTSRPAARCYSVRVYEDLEPVADLRIGRETDRISKLYAERVPRLANEYASRGTLQSGGFVAAKIDLYIEGATSLCREIANAWRELILRKDGGLSR